MPDSKQLEILTGGSSVWNRQREGRKGRPDLSNAKLHDRKLCHGNFSFAELGFADLNGSDLTNSDFTRANLDNACLVGAIADRAVFIGASLVGADLSGANLRGANFANADLECANLQGADIFDANFTGARLSGTDFKGAFARNTTFANCDLRYTGGLEKINHSGPSNVGIETIYKSEGVIAENFLSGCGVPESFITQMRSLVGAEGGIEFYSCFISYSGKDEEFARRLHGRMRDAHLRVWFAPEDIQGGKKLHEQIETAIRVYDKLLIVLSEASLQSEWVMDELRKAFKAERESGKRKLFPVRLTDYETLQRWECRDSLSGKDLAEEVRQYFIPDFSRWKEHDQFEAAFDRLLKDLKADSRETPPRP
jgi:uncharacterized protein YjbI with pentapeptide repeats